MNYHVGVAFFGGSSADVQLEMDDRLGLMG